MLQTLIEAIRETVIMVTLASAIAIPMGIIAGKILAKLHFNKNFLSTMILKILATLTKLSTGIPFIMIMLLILPITNIMIKSGISYTFATILPLAIAGTMQLAEKTYKIIINSPKKLVNFASNMGASSSQIVDLFLFKENKPEIYNEGIKLINILIGYSTIAGALGAGGIGQYAIESMLTKEEIIPLFIAIATLLLLSFAIEQIRAQSPWLTVNNPGRRIRNG